MEFASSVGFRFMLEVMIKSDLKLICHYKIQLEKKFDFEIFLNKENDRKFSTSCYTFSLCHIQNKSLYSHDTHEILWETFKCMQLGDKK